MTRALLLGFVLLATPPGFEIRLTTSGGMTGRGVGGIAVLQPGGAKLTRMDGSACEKPLPPAEQQALKDAVKAAKPEAWKEKYADPKNPQGCCDQIWTSIELELVAPGGKKTLHRTSWHDSAAGLLPEDLAAVAKALGAAKTALAKDCAAKPATP